MKILDWIFGKCEEINGAERCPTYLYRWTVMSTRWLKVYLHHFTGDDWSLDLHDHPKRFISVGLWGWYVEETPGHFYNRQRVYSAPWIRTFPAEHRHRISVPSKNCWTLAIVGRASREWGFWDGDRFMNWRSYVYGADAERANKMKACGD